MIEKIEQFVADKSVITEEQDKFQRYNFSKRIAETIIQRKSNESIVFGLYGAWGEGKSSIINFIDGVLKNEEEIIILHLNPWRYNDEESLLFNFFDRIATALEKEINTIKDKTGNLIKKYGGFSKFFGIDNEDISKAISDTNLEEFKLRVDGFLSESSKRLVVFIDDIDRLDRQEISVLFRLIKLTADFSNTTYILSFDEEMVASAIGSNFGSGDKKAGENFLEKIIQVPLTIPKAQPEALKKFCFDLLNKSLESGEIEIEEVEVERFVYRFTTNLLPKLDTPRLAVRYNNAVSFSLPLLYNEVNSIDLMLIEAIRVFYPEYFKFIKGSPTFFIGSYTTRRGNYDNKKEEKVERLKSKLNELGQLLSTEEKESIEELLKELFPKLKTAFHDNIYDMSSYQDWAKEKRICSPNYFDRYFSYTVIEGDISDIDFDLFITNISHHSIKEIITQIHEFSGKASYFKLLSKLEISAKKLTWNECKKLLPSLTKISSQFTKKGSFFKFGFDTDYKQALLFIYRCLELNKDEKDLLDTCIELIQSADNIEFGAELIHWYNKGETSEDKILNKKRLRKIDSVFIDKVLGNLKRGENVISKYPESNRTILRIWYSLNRKDSKSHINSFLQKNKKNVLTFLWSFTPTIHSSAHPDPYKGDLSTEAFEQIEKFVSLKKISTLVTKLFGKKTIDKEEVVWDDRRSFKTFDLNLARQFIYHYDNNLQKTRANKES